MYPEDDEVILDTSEGGWNPMVPRKDEIIDIRSFEFVMGEAASRPVWYSINEKGESVAAPDYRFFDHKQRYLSQMKTTFPDGSFLSTIHLSIDHNISYGGDPILWESLWFNIPNCSDEIMVRYTSLQAAVDGHNTLVWERFEKEFNNGTFRRPDPYHVQDVLDQLSSKATYPRTVSPLHPEDPAEPGDRIPEDRNPPAKTGRLRYRPGG